MIARLLAAAALAACLATPTHPHAAHVAAWGIQPDGSLICGPGTEATPTYDGCQTLPGIRADQL